MKTFRAIVAGHYPPTLKIGTRFLQNPFIRRRGPDNFTRVEQVPDRDLTLPEALATCDTVEDIEDTLASAGIVWREHVPYMAVTAGFLCGFLFWVGLVILEVVGP